MVNKYNYTALDGLVNINTLSPNKEYYYLVSKPKSLNPAAWGVEIAFYSLQKELLYHKKGSFANELPDKEVKHYTEQGDHNLPQGQRQEGIEFVRWSADGDLAYIFEYSVPSNYKHIFLDLTAKKIYSLEYKRENDFFVPPGFTRDYFNDILSKYNFGSKSTINDNPSKSIFVNKWYPIIK